MQKPQFLTLLFLLYSMAIMAQVRLDNASFEGEPADATMPVGWFDCSAYTTPDILPGYWGVYQEAFEGETYIGLITRQDGSFESIGQRLATPLKKKECYEFGLELAHSKAYADYNQPVKLRIWAGETRCKKDILIHETDWIEHTDWESYFFEFQTKKKQINYIIIEAYNSANTPRRGNILIDNISLIKICARA